MKSSFLLVGGFVLSLLLLLLHLSALEHSYYWTTPWFDILMHVSGGVIGALLSVFLFSKFSLTEHVTPRNIIAISCVSTLCAAFSWEVFEYMNGLAINQWLGYWSDTTSDVLFGLLGSMIGAVIIIFFFRNAHE